MGFMNGYGCLRHFETTVNPSVSFRPLGTSMAFSCLSESLRPEAFLPKLLLCSLLASSDPLGFLSGSAWAEPKLSCTDFTNYYELTFAFMHEFISELINAQIQSYCLHLIKEFESNTPTGSTFAIGLDMSLSVPHIHHQSHAVMHHHQCHSVTTCLHIIESNGRISFFSCHMVACFLALATVSFRNPISGSLTPSKGLNLVLAKFN